MADEQKPTQGDQPPIPEPKADDFDAKLAAALKAERERWEADAADKAKKDADAAAEKEAREQGKWKELADKADADRAAAQAEAATLRTSIALRDYLAEKHPHLAQSAKYILPLIPAGLSDKARDEAIAKHADEFAKAHAPATPKTAGAPAPRGTQRLPTDRLPNQSPEAARRRPFSSTAWNG